MSYQLFYWPDIQGRGEFVRLALEAAGADYEDVARQSGPGKGVEAMLTLMGESSHPPFAPPFLKAGRQLIAQTANILLFLGPSLQLAPDDEVGRLWTHQLQLTVADFVTEIHDVHHPISSNLYYEDQKDAAKQAARLFLDERVPKYMGYFDGVLQANGGRNLVGNELSYVDLSIFQLVAGLRYAFPQAMKRLEADYPGLVELAERVSESPKVAAYLVSPRRIAFNTDGIFRHYEELDG